MIPLKDRLLLFSNLWSLGRGLALCNQWMAVIGWPRTTQRKVASLPMSTTSRLGDIRAITGSAHERSVSENWYITMKKQKQKMMDQNNALQRSSFRWVPLNEYTYTSVSSYSVDIYAAYCLPFNFAHPLLWAWLRQSLVPLCCW